MNWPLSSRLLTTSLRLDEHSKADVGGRVAATLGMEKEGKAGIAHPGDPWWCQVWIGMASRSKAVMVLRGWAGQASLVEGNFPPKGAHSRCIEWASEG